MNKQIDVDVIVGRVYDMLNRRDFCEWFSDDGNYARHIQGDLPKVTKETILVDLKKLLKLD